MFIAQAFKKDNEFWRYLPIPITFFLLMLLNFLAVTMLELDVEVEIQKQIAVKGENRVLVESLTPLVVFFFFLLFWVKYVHKQSIRSLTTARKKIDWKRIGYSFFVWSVVTVLLTFGAYFLSPESFVWNFKPVPFAILAVIAILMVPLQTSFEEYFFRGYLMQGIGILVRNKWIPLIITSVFFGLMHIANPEVGKIGLILLCYYIGTGLFLGIITLMDDGIELALGFHAANNLVAVLLVTADWTAFQTHSVFKDVSEPSAGFDILLPVFIIYPILLIIFSKRYKWSGWKEKLTGKIYPEHSTIINEIGNNHE